MSTALVGRQAQQIERNRQIAVAYLLWLPMFFGLCGLHRMYAGRWISGVIWMLTGGLCGVGQFVDLFLMPRMIDDFRDGRPVW